MNPDPKIKQELDEDIAVQGTPAADEPAVTTDDKEDAKPENVETMIEAQEKAADEREEGGYQ